MSLVGRPARRPIRLPAGSYQVPASTWLVTNSTRDRSAPVFTDRALARSVRDLFVERGTALGAILDAYCLMPDHAHLIVRVTESD